MLQGAAWEITPHVLSHFSAVHSRMLSSIVCEDGFNRQKRSKKTGANKKGRVDRAFGALMKQRVLGEVHKYSEISLGAAPGRDVCLPREAYESASYKPTIPLGEIITYQSTTEYYSPAAERHAVCYTDLEVIKYVQQHHLHSSVCNLWLGCLLDSRHQVLVRDKRNGSEASWNFALLHLPASGVLVWPAAAMPWPGRPGEFYFQPSTEIKDMSSYFFVALDAESVEAIHFIWRSPSWMAKHCPGAEPGDNVGMRAVPTGPPDDLMRIAAREAFFQIKTATLVWIANYLKVHLSQTTSLFRTLFELVQAVLGIDDQAALEILAKRMGSMDADPGETYAQLLKMDDACELLDATELKSVKPHKNQIKDGWMRRFVACRSGGAVDGPHGEFSEGASGSRMSVQW